MCSCRHQYRNYLHDFGFREYTANLALVLRVPVFESFETPSIYAAVVGEWEVGP
jgi:hypothetical protein